MAQGTTTNEAAIANLKASQTHSIPPPPSLAGFSFQTIGKPPELLNRLGDGLPGQNGTAQYNFSPSPSPNLEEQLLMPSESSGDSDAQQHPPTRRNRLLDALAPNVDVETNDMYVKDDDVNRFNIGASAVPEAIPSSTTLISRLHSGSTSASQPSHAQSFATCPVALSQSASVSEQNDVASDASAEQGNTARTVKTRSILGSTSTTSVLTVQLPQTHPSIPPTPPPEIEGPTGSSVPKTVTHYDALRAAHTRLQSLLDTGLAETENFSAIRELAQVARVESTSVSLASQKSVSLAQKALALAQESMSASQECVKVSHAAKMHWEAAIQGCEKFMEQRSANFKQQQDAFKKELSALGESIKSVEEADRKHTAQWESQRKALVQEQARRAAAAARAPPPPPILSSSSSAAVPPRNTPVAPIPVTEPTVPSADQQQNNARQYVLADEFESLKREVEKLRKSAHDRTGDQPEDRKKAVKVERRQREELKQHHRHMTLEAEHKRSLSQPEQPAPVTTAPPLPHRPRATQQPLPPAVPVADPRLREQALKEKLKSERKLSIGASSSSGRSSGSPTTPTFPLNGHMRSQSQHFQHSRDVSGSLASQLKQEPPPAKAGPIQIKAEDKEVKVPPALSRPPVPPLPSRKPLSTSPMHLEYQPSATTPTASLPAPSRPSNPPPLRIPHRGIVQSPSKGNVTSGTDSEESPIHLHRQGSDPGNLPILFPDSILLETFPDLGASQSSMWSQIPPSYPNTIDNRILPPPAAQPSAPAPPRIHIPQSQSVPHPPIATLSAGPSPVETSASSTVSTTGPPLPTTNHHLLNRNRGKGAHRVTSSMSSVCRPPVSAQLPPKPVTGPPPLSVRRNSQPAHSQSNSNTSSPVEPLPTQTQQQQQQQPPAPTTRKLISRRSGSDTRRPGPPSSRPPIADSDRSYVPARTPPSPLPLDRRSRSAERRPRNERPQPHGDHYPHGRMRSLSPRRSPMPRSRSRSVLGSTAARRQADNRRPPPPRRVMQPHRRGLSSACDDPVPPPSVAGVKRPFEDTNGSAAPAPVRRRVGEQVPQPSVVAVGPSSQVGEPASPHQVWTEDWSRNAEYSGSPGSSSDPILGTPAVPHKRQAQGAGEDQGPAKLASRLSDARTVAEKNAQVHQLPRQLQVQHGRSRSSPSSRYNSPTLEASPSAPSLLQRFGEQGSPRCAASGSRGRGGHRDRRGRGGGSGVAGQSHQSLNNRISSGGSTIPLLQRIHQG